MSRKVVVVLIIVFIRSTYLQLVLSSGLVGGTLLFHLSQRPFTRTPVNVLEGVGLSLVLGAIATGLLVVSPDTPEPVVIALTVLVLVGIVAFLVFAVIFALFYSDNKASTQPIFPVASRRSVDASGGLEEFGLDDGGFLVELNLDSCTDSESADQM